MESFIATHPQGMMMYWHDGQSMARIKQIIKQSIESRR